MSHFRHELINSPKIRMAQFMADKMQCNQAILMNDFGGLDIKPEKYVVVINNPNVLCIIEPARDVFTEELV